MYNVAVYEVRSIYEKAEGGYYVTERVPVAKTTNKVKTRAGIQSLLIRAAREQGLKISKDRRYAYNDRYMMFIERGRRYQNSKAYNGYS